VPEKFPGARIGYKVYHQSSVYTQTPIPMRIYVATGGAKMERKKVPLRRRASF
jgi:hypothetical protein